MISKFKQTEIGLIPEDWELRPIKSSFDFVGNNTFARNSMSNIGEVVNIHYGDVLIKYGANVDVSSDSVMFLDPSIRTIAAHRLQNGDIVMADTAEDETAGKCCEIIGAENKQVEAGLHTFVLRPKNKYAPKFLGYAFNADFYHNQLVPLMQGTKVTSISKSAVGATFLLCPPLAEQERIATALSDMDKLIIDLESLIAKKQLIKQGTMQQLLTGKKRLNGFSGKWIIKQLGNTCIIKARIGWQGLTTDEYLNSGNYYLITGTDFNDGHIDWKHCHYVSKERYEQDKHIQIKNHDVLITKDGTIGKVAFLGIIPQEGTLNSGVFVVRAKDPNINQEYLGWVFLSKFFTDFIDKLTAGSTIQHLYQKDIVSFEFPVPPSICEQMEISSVLNKFDEDITFLKAKLDKYVNIKQGMMQELLTGKIRLV